MSALSAQTNPNPATVTRVGAVGAMLIVLGALIAVTHSSDDHTAFLFTYAFMAVGMLALTGAVYASRAWWGWKVLTVVTFALVVFGPMVEVAVRTINAT